MKAIDLFSGAGGFSTGAKMAGCDVVWAANHWQSAVDTHAANHPETQHACQDLQQTNWADVPEHDLLLASPCCQGHSSARGKENGNPQHDASRSTAWAVVDAAEYHQPSFAVIENVPEFINWKLYPAWRMAMETLVYCLSPYFVNAANHGVPQDRERLFIVCTKGNHPIMLNLQEQRHIAARSFIDFDSGNWSDIEKPGRAVSTLNRIRNGRIDFGDNFVAPFYGGGSGLTGRSLDRPIGTITTRDRWSIIKGKKMRMFSAQECQAAMGFPDDYIRPTQHRLAVHMFGNAVCPPVARDIITQIKLRN